MKFNQNLILLALLAIGSSASVIKREPIPTAVADAYKEEYDPYKQGGKDYDPYKQ
ncbi:8640_t:CDS:2, partial [Funneliformis geosporum]